MKKMSARRLDSGQKCNNFVITFKQTQTTVKIPAIRIGNSKGIRLSKTIRERYNIQDHVDLILEKDQMIIKPMDNPREGWEEAFRLMHENQDDQLLINDVFEDEDLEE